MNENEFDFTLEPGRELKAVRYNVDIKPVFSIVMPFYNDSQYIEQSVYSVLNQTFPYYELIIVDDGSTDEESLEKLEEVAKLDSRIRVLHKENGGVSVARDYAADHASEESKYLVFLDSDDLIDPTFLECAYWTLETNKEASWAYFDSVGFDGTRYLWKHRGGNNDTRS